MKKRIIVKLLAILVNLTPIIIALLWKGSLIIKRADTTISAVLLFVLIVTAIILKDSFYNYFKGTMAAVKLSILMFLLSWLFITIGEPLMWVSGATILGGILALPLNMWYNELIRPVSETAFIKSLKELVNKGDDNESN